ncbi:WD40 repeat domain-containing protein [Nonomuraea sp. NPDC050540]|uniref:WD40 repeat domain-containing protein n=1 Tax=Nonomuraea sp. NPDC050540 TaxID=3364367 RepID=UPI00378E7C66
MITIMGQNAWKDEEMARRAVRTGAGTLAVALGLLVAGTCWHTPVVMATPVALAGHPARPALPAEAPPFGSELRGPLKGHTRGISALAIGERSDGTRVIVSASFDKTLRVWSLDTGKPLGRPITGHHRPAYDVAIGKRSNGTPVIVSGGEDGTVRMWNLDTGKPLGKPLRTGHALVHAVAVGKRSDGTPVIISSGEGRKTVALHMWNLNTGKLIGKPWWGHYSGVMDIEVTKRADGKPVFVTGSTDSRMRIWNLDTRKPIGKPLNTCFTCMVYGVAIAERSDGQRVMISAEVPNFPLDEGSPPATLRIWSLESGRPLGEPLTHEGNAHHPFVVTTKDGDGTPVIVSGGNDRNVVVRNLDTGRPLSGPFAGHTDNISALAVGTREDGTPVVVSGSLDTTIRVWSLA